MVQVLATNTQSRVIPRVLQEQCRACRKCLARQFCRTKALLQVDPAEAPVVDAANCYGCHKCVPACPFGAITV
jgi:Fe-S-cluster-containing hydrogenase component 2